MLQTELPSEFKGINRFAIKAMLYLNGFAHIVIGLLWQHLSLCLLGFSSLKSVSQRMLTTSFMALFMHLVH